ncbi:MAG: hypothetical protein F4112_07665 [Holophagales bacterium]|nr:hypothetical protein [Holophagales bacterium]MYD22108.1 hypothetical protein [Holophagales bacterium]MYI32829.1 hypothetical protein [Holophagales bacterium]
MTAKAQRSSATTASRLEGVVAGLQEAALYEQRWNALSAQIDDAAGTFASRLVVASGVGGVPDFLFSRALWRGETVEEIERLYLEDYAIRDERVDRTDRMPLGCVLHNTEILTEEEQKKSPVYCDFLPCVGSNNQVCVRMRGLYGTDIIWVLTARAGRDWSSEQTGAVEHLLPHVRHFVRVRQALAAADARESSLIGLLNRSGLAVLHLDQGGCVLEANAPARELLAAGDRILQRDRQLRARSPDTDAQLGRLLSACCRKGVGGSMTIHPRGESADRAPLLLCACPVPPDLTSFDSRGVFAQILLTRLGDAPSVDTRQVARLYDLTPTESRVAGLLAEGRTVSEIAASMGRGGSTIRWHVKNLHSKLGVHRQADLVRLVLATAAATPAE